MKIVVDQDFLQDIANNLRATNKNLSIIAEIDALIGRSEEYKEEANKLENQEIWIKCFFDGYFYKFNDMSINVEIRELNPNFGENDLFLGTTTLFSPINEEDGCIDLTPLLFTLLHKMNEKPDGKFKCFITGFGRQLHLSKDLLSTPLSEEILKVFGSGKIK
jgi:hypothetical protein